MRALLTAKHANALCAPLLVVVALPVRSKIRAWAPTSCARDRASVVLLPGNVRPPASQVEALAPDFVHDRCPVPFCALDVFGIDDVCDDWNQPIDLGLSIVEILLE